MRRLILIGLAAVVGAGFVRGIASQQVERAASINWAASCDTDLEIVGNEDRPRLEHIVKLAKDVERLRWSEEPLATRPLTWLTRRDDKDGMRRRLDQVRVGLRGSLEEMNQRLEGIVRLPVVEKDATLRLLAFGRWRLQGGSYEDAVRFYDQRSEELLRRPTKTASPTATAPPSATPTRRGRGPARRPPARQRPAPRPTIVVP